MRLCAITLQPNSWPQETFLQQGVQWFRLQAEEGHAGDGLTPETFKQIARKGANFNETYELAASLAARLGLERVYLVDDHHSGGAVHDESKPYANALESAWKTTPSKAKAIERGIQARCRYS